MDAKTFKPMLAATVDDVSLLTFPLMASPKLDGVRAVIIDGVVMSRNLKPIPNKHVQKLFGKKKYNGLDGELIAGNPWGSDAFRKTGRAVMSIEGTPMVTFYVFDSTAKPYDLYCKRLTSLCDVVEGSKGICIVQSDIVNDVNRLDELEHQYLLKGYEGVMLRTLNGLYKFGRSTFKEAYLMKLKRFKDSEAEVIGFEEQMRNANEAEKDALGRTKRSTKKAGMVPKATLGAILARDVVTGVEFGIGSGFDDATKLDIWRNRDAVMGKFVKYRFFPSGSKDKPRFPVFLGFRDPIDM